MKPVTTRLPDEDLEAIDSLADELGVDRSAVLRRLLRSGLEEWKRETALGQLREHRITVREAADLADVSYVEMVTLAAEAGIDIGYASADLERDLDRL